MNETTTERRSAHLREVAADYQRLAAQLAQSDDADAFPAVAALALARVPHAYAAIITPQRHGRFVTAAATNDVARRADSLQYEIGSGPCVDAIVDRTVYQPEDLADDPRWPEY